MTSVLYHFVSGVEEIEPQLFDLLNGDQARDELQILMDVVAEPYVTLVSVNGEQQELVSTDKIGARQEKGEWLLEVPVLVVQQRRTIPPKEPITEPRAE